MPDVIVPLNLSRSIWFWMVAFVGQVSGVVQCMVAVAG